MSGNFGSLLKFMKDSGYTCSEEWLAACVEWIRENNNNVTDALMKHELFEQWKDANLMEMECSCLPVNLKNQKVTTLRGKFGLQVNCVQDIGESAYNQWKKIKKLENENTNVAATDSTAVSNAWEPKPLRCLYLTLTDGSQTIYGMELKRLPAVDLSLRPGAKILVMGPVECRRGILQLCPQNIKIIGGEVESLIETNSVEANIRQTLHNPPEPDPVPVIQRNPAISHSSAPSTITQAISGEFPDDFPNDNFPEDDFPEDDDIFMEIDETDLIIQSSSTSTNNPSSSGRANQSIISISNAETQRIPNSQFNLEMRPPASRLSNSNQQANKRMLSPSSTSSTDSIPSTNFSSTKVKSKVTQPPPKVQKSNATSSSVTSAKPVTLRSVTQTKISDFTSEAGFSSAKSLLPSSKPKPKQLKIDGYMKPMPVIIKPPTPKGTIVKTKKNIQLPVIPVNDSSEDLFDTSDAAPEDEEFDQGLMDLIDDSIDNELRRLEDNIAEETVQTEEVLVVTDDSPTRTFLPPSSVSSCSTNNRSKISPPTGIVKPQTNLATRDNSSSDECIEVPVKVSKIPFVYLKQVQEHWDSFLEQDEPTTIKVKACVATIVSNIRVEEEAWNLEVSINDGTASMTCKMSPELLNEIIGFTPAQMKKIKGARTPESKEKIAKGMKALTTTLVHLNAIFEIQLGPDPILIHIQEVSSYHLSALKDRLSNIC